jgi:hypothetical protein
LFNFKGKRFPSRLRIFQNKRKRKHIFVDVINIILKVSAKALHNSFIKIAICKEHEIKETF